MIDYKVDRSQGIIFIKVLDSTSADEIITHIQFILNDPHFQPNYHIIAKIEKETRIDARLPEETEIIQNLLVDFKQKRNGSKCAIVIESKTMREVVEYGLKLIEYISSDVQIFSNNNEALEWIEVSCTGKKK